MTRTPQVLRIARGFTLTEVLIVVGAIVLLLALALPMWSVLLGHRSIEAAQNIISAALGRVREQALASQEQRGIAFYVDPATDRVMMAVVYNDDPGGKPDQLELLGDTERIALPVGVGVSFINNDTRPRNGSSRPSRYVLPGVIMFDGHGQLVARDFVIRRRNLLGQLVLPADQQFMLGITQLGMVLYDRQALSGQAEADHDNWLDANGLAVLVNRYNGTLMRGE